MNLRPGLARPKDRPAEKRQRRADEDKPIAVLHVKAVAPQPARIPRYCYRLRSPKINGPVPILHGEPDHAELVDPHPPPTAPAPPAPPAVAAPQDRTARLDRPEDRVRRVLGGGALFAVPGVVCRNE